MWTYYRDVTLYAVALCLLIGLASSPARDGIKSGVIVTILIFGMFGTGLGILAFRYFQKPQYYMYFNLGFTKRYLILRTWIINFGVSFIVTILAVVLL